MGTKQTRQQRQTRTQARTTQRTTATQQPRTSLTTPVPSYTVQFRQAIKKIRHAAAELALQDNITNPATADATENVYALLSDIIDNAFDASQYVKAAEVVKESVVSAASTPQEVMVPRTPYQQLGPDMLVDVAGNSSVAEWDEDELSLQMSADDVDEEQAS